MREIRLYGSEGGGAGCSPYPYQASVVLFIGEDEERRRARRREADTLQRPLTHTRLSSKPPSLRSARRSASASPKPITPSVANINMLAV